jgi:hypothetical protein
MRLSSERDLLPVTGKLLAHQMQVETNPTCSGDSGEVQASNPHPHPMKLHHPVAMDELDDPIVGGH